MIVAATGPLSNKSVVGFLRPIPFQSTRLRSCLLKAYQDKCHQGKHCSGSGKSGSDGFLCSSIILHQPIDFASSFMQAPSNIRQNHDLSFVLCHTDLLQQYSWSDSVECQVRTLPSFLRSQRPSPMSTPSFSPSRRDDE
jgi:hypothetical protein